MTDHLDPADTAQQLDECCSRLNELVEGLSKLQGSGDPGIADLERLVEEQHERLRKLSDALHAGAEISQRTPERLEREAARKSASSEDKGACLLRGSSMSLSIPNLLELLGSHKMTGTLRISTDDETFTLELLDGDVVHACSDDAPKDQLLCSILVARNKISLKQLEQFFERFTKPAEAISDQLESEQLVSRGDLQEALEHQVQMLFLRLYAAGYGSFFFHEGRRRDAKDRIRMNITQLLLDSARVHDEEQRPDEAVTA